MKKIIRLNESDLIKVVKRVIKEQKNAQEVVDMLKAMKFKIAPTIEETQYSISLNWSNENLDEDNIMLVYETSEPEVFIQIQTRTGFKTLCQNIKESIDNMVARSKGGEGNFKMDGNWCVGYVYIKNEDIKMLPDLINFAIEKVIEF
jgi:hypothetical protein